MSEEEAGLLKGEEESTVPPVLEGDLGALSQYRDLDEMGGEVVAPTGFAAYPRESLEIDPVKSHLWTADIVVCALVMIVAVGSLLEAISMFQGGRLPSFLATFLLAIIGILVVAGVKSVFQWRLGWLIIVIGTLIVAFSSFIYERYLSPMGAYREEIAFAVLSLFALCGAIPIVYGIWRFWSWRSLGARRLRESMARRLGGGRGR